MKYLNEILCSLMKYKTYVSIFTEIASPVGDPSKGEQRITTFN